MKKDLERQCREKMHVVSDENIAWLMHSLYMDFPVDGPYISEKNVQGGRPTCEDHKGRGLFKQIFLGAYGPAGIVYSIEGSPPRGIIYVSANQVIFDGLIRYSASKLVIIGRYQERTRYSIKTELAKYFFSCFEKEENEWEKLHTELVKPNYKYSKSIPKT